MVTKVRDRLMNFRKLFFREKYRFDQGNAFLVFINFALLVTSIVKADGTNASYITYYIIGGLLGTWFLGYFLDRIVRVQEIQEKVILTRSPIWQENFLHHDTQDTKLDSLLTRLERLESRLELFYDKGIKGEKNGTTN